MDETIRLLHERYAKETLRLHAVLMGIASAAIAFAIHETADQTWSLSIALRLAAILFWGLSFAAGVLFSKNFVSATRANIGMLEAKKIEYVEGAEWSKDEIEKFNSKSSFAYRFQQWTLLFGAIIYLLGHIMHVAQLD